MKKTLVALAALAVVGAASAQSTVSITGKVGAAYQSVDSATGVASRGMNLTNADFKLAAMEDLGGGLRAMASVSYETPVTGAVGAGTFSQGVVRRDTSLALMGQFGLLSFNNTRSSNWLTKAFVAPAELQHGIYDLGAMGIVNRSPVDVLTFQTKAMSGVQGLVQWTDTGTDGTATPSVNVLTLGGTYAQGPLAAGLQYKMHYFTDAYKNTTQAFGGIGRKNRLEAFATYDLGMAKVGVGFDGGNVGTVDNALAPAALGGGSQAMVDFNKSSAYSLGVSAPVGAMTVGANWAKRENSNMFETVVKYDLSKRTYVNTSWGRQSQDALNGAAGAITTGHQYRVGLYHTF
jgi:predicted porin